MSVTIYPAGQIAIAVIAAKELDFKAGIIENKMEVHYATYDVTLTEQIWFVIAKPFIARSFE